MHFSNARSAHQRQARDALPLDILQRLPFCAAAIDDGGRVLAANGAMTTLLGSPLPLIDTRIQDYITPEHRPMLIGLIARALAAREPMAPVEICLVIGGKRSRVMASASVQPTAEGVRPLLLLQCADLPGTASAGDDREAIESRWLKALDGASAGVWDHNFRTGEMYYSDVWRTLRGLGPDDPLASSTEEWLLTVHPDDRDRVRIAIARQQLGDPEYRVYEYRERHKDGHYIWIECRGTCVEWDEDGQPVRIIGTDSDVSARKQAEEMLSHMSRRLELALETSKVGIFEADLETFEVHWDDRLVAMYGLGGAGRTFPNGTWQSLLHPDDYDQAVGRNLESIKTGDELYNQYRIFRRDDGEMRYLRSRASTFVGPDGRKRLLGVTWDVSEDIHLHQQLEGAKKRMEYMALHDHLTELPNRRYLDAMLDEVGAACERDGQSLAVFHIDLDRFKQINDTLGHTAGDEMLKHAARILQDNIGPTDFVARIGGDEFVILSPFEGTRKKLSTLADRIIDSMRKPVMLEGHDTRFGSSIGIAVSGKRSINARQLLLNADMALYVAKNRGRNRHEFFADANHSRAVETKRTSDRILEALERDEFEPAYQFQFDARTLDIVGVETLARWRHPEQGLLSPGAFLDLAEDLDVVSRIDALILEQALDHLRHWREIGLNVPKLSVNVSSRRLHDPGLKRALLSLDIPPGLISFELLESIFLDDFNATVKENLKLLQRLGIAIELDDFGTGHASIVSLLKLNPHTFKIDRQLVIPLTESEDQRKLVGSIIDIGRSLNVKVVAEGVETAEHVRILRELECDILQGFGLCRPIAAGDVEEFVRAQKWRRLA